MMVVPVLITSCQESEYLKIGPVMAQIMITAKAIRKAQGLPVALVVLAANFSKNTAVLFLDLCFMMICLIVNININTEIYLSFEHGSIYYYHSTL